MISKAPAFANFSSSCNSALPRVINITEMLLYFFISCGAALVYDSTPVALQVNVRSFETVSVVIPSNLYFIVIVPNALFPLFEHEWLDICQLSFEIV